MTTCNCRSYNRPDWGGAADPIHVPPLSWMTRPISIDPCILPALERLWYYGIRTYASCCGHRIFRPHVVVGGDARYAVTQARVIIAEVDSREWDVFHEANRIAIEQWNAEGNRRLWELGLHVDQIA